MWFAFYSHSDLDIPAEHEQVQQPAQLDNGADGEVTGELPEVVAVAVNEDNAPVAVDVNPPLCPSRVLGAPRVPLVYLSHYETILLQVPTETCV